MGDLRWFHDLPEELARLPHYRYTDAGWEELAAASWSSTNTELFKDQAFPAMVLDRRVFLVIPKTPRYKELFSHRFDPANSLVRSRLVTRVRMRTPIAHRITLVAEGPVDLPPLEG